MSFLGSSSGRARTAGPVREETFVLCRLGENHFAVPVTGVREIVAPQKLTPLPGSRPGILGAFDHRGSVVPVVEFAWALGRTPEKSTKTKWILLFRGEETFGLAVAQVIDVIRVPETMMRSVSHDETTADFTTGQVIPVGKLMAFVVSVDQLALLAYPGSGRRPARSPLGI